MANIRLILNNGHADAVLTATSEETGLEIENTQNERRARVWRSTSDAAQTITAVMPVSISGVGGIVLTNTNLTTDADVEVDLKNGVTVIDTVTLVNLCTNFDGTTDWVAWFDVDTAVDQYEMVITDTDNPDGYLQITQVICGPYISPGYNFALGAGFEVDEDIQHTITAGLSPRSSGTGAERRELSIDLKFIEEADRATLVDGLLDFGMGSVLYVSMYPDQGSALEGRHQFAAKRMTKIKTSHWGNRFWDQSLVFREV